MVQTRNRYQKIRQDPQLFKIVHRKMYIGCNRHTRDILMDSSNSLILNVKVKIKLCNEGIKELFELNRPKADTKPEMQKSALC